MKDHFQYSKSVLLLLLRSLRESHGDMEIGGQQYGRDQFWCILGILGIQWPGGYILGISSSGPAATALCGLYTLPRDFHDQS